MSCFVAPYAHTKLSSFAFVLVFCARIWDLDVVVFEEFVVGTSALRAVRVDDLFSGLDQGAPLASFRISHMTARLLPIEARWLAGTGGTVLPVRL